MCSSCVEEHPDLCPACRREFFIGSDKFVDKKTLIIVFIGGLIGLIITYFFLLPKYPDDTLAHLFPQGFIYFSLGISAAYTPYLYKNSDIFNDLKEMPFLGFKLMLILIVITIISCIPALVYLYKVFLYVFTRKQRNI